MKFQATWKLLLSELSYGILRASHERTPAGQVQETLVSSVWLLLQFLEKHLSPVSNPLILPVNMVPLGAFTWHRIMHALDSGLNWASTILRRKKLCSMLSGRL